MTPPHPFAMKTIQHTVAGHYGVRVADILGPRRNPEYSEPRQVAMYLCRLLTPASFPEIGAAFHRDHSTVFHGFEKITARRHADPKLSARLDYLTESLTPKVQQSRDIAEEFRADWKRLGVRLERRLFADHEAALKAMREIKTIVERRASPGDPS